MGCDAHVSAETRVSVRMTAWLRGGDGNGKTKLTGRGTLPDIL
jgi:hypothetical protein